MEIPEISIPEIYIPDVPEPYTPHYLTITTPPEIDAPGCTYQHRDIKNTGNRNLLLEDPNGVFTTCDFPFPSFVPLDYTPENLVITEEAPVNNETPPLPEAQTPDATIPEKKEEEIVIPDCPGKNDRRVGEFTSELRTERVKGYKRGEDGIECIAIYEDVPFIDQYIPTASAVVNTVVIATVAASTPLLLNVIRPAIKQLINKITKKKKDTSS